MSKEKISIILKPFKHIVIEKTHIFHPCYTPEYVNTSIINTLLQDDINCNREYLLDTKKCLSIDPKKAEWIVWKSINGSKQTGNGNSPIDITYQDIGIDVAVLSLRCNISAEKSIIQNFAECGNTLDELFSCKQFDKVVNEFKTTLSVKLNDALNTYKLKKIYYCIFLCTQNNIYLVWLNINIEIIQNMEILEITDKSIKLNRVIDSKYGESKIYKSKKRLELRLHTDIIGIDSTLKFDCC